MSLLIKGMKMPKNCIVCDVERQANCVVWKGAAPSKTGRHEDCPLIELTQHGRLIDADALNGELNSIKSTFGTTRGLIEGGLGIAISTVNSIPTIIEAEVDR